jgi:hypothetical protein
MSVFGYGELRGISAPKRGQETGEKGYMKRNCMLCTLHERL